MKAILTLGMIICCFNSFSQTHKNKAFEMVKTPDSVKVILSSFLANKEKVKVDGAILTFNLIDKKDYLYKDGIYSFRLLGPHYNRQIFIANKGVVHIFNGYYISELLPEFNEYIKKTELPTKLKIAYLKAISVFLDEEYKIENS